MDKNSQRQESKENTISTLNAAIEGLNLTKEILSITPAKAVCGSVSAVLAMIRVRPLPVHVDRCGLIRTQDSMINEGDYFELGLACAGVCTALGRGMNGKELDDFSQSVSEAIAQLTTWVEPVTNSLDNPLTILLIAVPWRGSKGRSSDRASAMQSLDFSTQRMTKRRSQLGSWTSTDSLMSSPCVESVFTCLSLIVSFQAELAVNIRGAISDIHHDVSKIREGIGGQVRSVSVSFIRPIGNGRILTFSQAQARSAAPFTKKPHRLHWDLAYLENHLPRLQEHALDATT